MKQELQAVSDMASRYAGAFRIAWRRRAEFVPVDRNDDERAFQPSVIALTETPVSAAPRRTMQAVVALFIVALAWAAFGKLDIVAVADGKIVTDSRTKTIQSLETAIVRRIAVGDGQTVTKGQVLLELDAVGVSSDVDRAADGLRSARLNAARSAAMAAAYETDRAPSFDAPEGVPEAQVADARRLAMSEFDAFHRKTDGLRAAVAQKEAERHTIDLTIGPLREYAKIAGNRVADYERLLDKQYVSRQEYLVRVQERINAERDAVSQQNRLNELDSAIVGAREELASTIGEARRAALDAERQAREQVGQLTAEAARAAERGASMRIVAPVTGTVQALAIHTLGGVVTPAQPLMSIVPAGESVEAEANVLNTDIGFVEPGQSVVVKVQSFPYTRYGYLTAHVSSVSHDAVTDEKLGLIFPARVTLDRDTMDIEGKSIRLTPGMAVSVEIKTGHRSVLAYLLDPLRTHVDEGMRER